MDRSWLIAGTEITVMETPGHTPGSVLFLTKDAIFTGDTIFAGRVRKTDFEGGNERQMMQSLRKINNLCHRGHYPMSRDMATQLPH